MFRSYKYISDNFSYEYIYVIIIVMCFKLHNILKEKNIIFF